MVQHGCWQFIFVIVLLFPANSSYQEVNFTLKEISNTDEDVAFTDPSENSVLLDGDILEDLRVRNALLDEQYLWPNGIVPYILSEEYDDTGRSLISRAMQEFHKRTCIRFVPRTQETDYIYISKDKGCASYIGRVGSDQHVSLSRGCYSLGVIMHELMHTLGFVHEQNRPDRDEYISVLWDNVKEGREGNFVKLDWYTIRQLDEKYDYSSILHYSRFAFSKNPKSKPTLEPKRRGARIGQRKALSAGDIRKINKLYNCKNKTV